MKKSLSLVSFILYAVSIVAQRQYDYYDDDAVAGGADRALNGIIIIVLLVVGFIVLVILGNIFFKTYYWFNPEKDPENISRKKREELERANRTKVQTNPKKDRTEQRKTEAEHLTIPIKKPLTPIFSDKGYDSYVASFEMTIKPESKDIMRDLYSYKMYEGDKLISAWHGAGTTNRNYVFNPKDGTRIICDNAYDDYDRRFERSIILPNSVVAIGNNAFMFNHLDKFTIPPSVKYITGNPFSNRCKEIICLSDRFSFENGCLLSHELSLMIADLSEDTKVKETPKGIKYIGRGAYNLQSPQMIKVDSSVVAIADGAFGGVNLRIIVFYGTIGYIDANILGCSNLKKILIPKGTFEHYKQIIPKERHSLLSEMGNVDYSDTELLQKAILEEDAKIYPSLLVSLGGKNDVPIQSIAYIDKEKEDYFLSKVKEKDWENAIIDWGEHENEEHDDWDYGEARYSSDGRKFLKFEDESEEYTIKEGVEIICDEALYGMRDESVVKFPSTVKVLGNFLYGAISKGEFIIPQSVQKITGNPFAECDGSIRCDSPYFVYENGVLYDKTKSKLISAMWGYDVNEANRIIDPQVLMIGRYSFYNKSFLDSKPLVLPSSVLYIGNAAFSHTIIDIVIPKNLIEIGESAFAWSYVKQIALPSSLTKLGKCAFEYCKELTNITLSPNLEVIEEGAFKNCAKLNHVYIPEGIKVLKKDCFSWCESLNEVRFPNSLEKIEEGAFTLCPLSTVVVSRNTIIEEKAFSSRCEILYRE